jgi:hypothetical protein
VEPLPEHTLKILREAVRLLTGPKRRRFQAQVTLDYLDGNARQAERVCGWGRQTVQLGLHELRTGITCLDRYTERGRHATEADHPQLAHDIRELVEPHAQADPKFQSPFAYTRITAKAVRRALIDCKGDRDEDLPCERTIRNLLNRTRSRAEGDSRSEANKGGQHESRTSRRGISGNLEGRVGVSDEWH